MKHFFDSNSAFPFRTTLSLDVLIEHWRKASGSSTGGARSLAQEIIAEVDAAPELKGPILDQRILEKHSGTVDKLSSAIFPKLFWHNEIKACLVPWDHRIVKMTPRFEKLVEAHGGPIFSNENSGKEIFLLSAYYAVLARHYDLSINIGKPLLLSLDDRDKGLNRFYKALGNMDLLEIKVHGKLKPLTPELRKEITERSLDLDFIRSVVDANQFELYGLWLLTLVDVTSDESISKLKLKLLANDSLYQADRFPELEHDVHCIFGTKDLKLGYAGLDPEAETFAFKSHFDRSRVLPVVRRLEEGGVPIPEFAPALTDFEPLVVSHTRALSSTEAGEAFAAAGIESMVLAPLKYDDRPVGLLELTSDKPGRFTQIDLLRIQDITPLFSTAMERSLHEYHTRVEALIKERFTTLHRSVEWHFHEIAENLYDTRDQGDQDGVPPIIFKDVIPLYGQADIRNSSVLRNEAISQDMIAELEQVIAVLEAIHTATAMPAVEEMRFRVRSQLNHVKDGLRAGDEASVSDLLREEVHPMLEHFAKNTGHANKEIQTYFSTLDEELGILYDRRGAYERSVSRINDTIAATLARENESAQKHYPHFFEKFKTDGVDYNAYIGASISPRVPYDPVYLRNLRLWQLIVMCNIAREVEAMQGELEVPMNVAPLVLVHSSPLSIRFRMDEKKFDVDGTYNMRYEIVKKRIDKATIKGTKDRLTEPGLLSVVISQEREAQEYMQYFEFLRKHDLITGDVQKHLLEPIPGATGLEALRVQMVLGKENTLIRDVMELVKR